MIQFVVMLVTLVCDKVSCELVASYDSEKRNLQGRKIIFLPCRCMTVSYNLITMYCTTIFRPSRHIIFDVEDLSNGFAFLKRSSGFLSPLLFSPLLRLFINLGSVSDQRTGFITKMCDGRVGCCCLYKFSA